MSDSLKEAIFIGIELIVFTSLMVVVALFTFYADTVVKDPIDRKNEVVQNLQTNKELMQFDNVIVTRGDIANAVTKYNGEYNFIIQEVYGSEDEKYGDNKYKIECSQQDLCLRVDSGSVYWDVKTLKSAMITLFEKKYATIGIQGNKVRYRANIVYDQSSDDIDTIAFTLITDLRELD